MPDTNGTQKCWQSIMVGLLGPVQERQGALALGGESGTAFETMNWKGGAEHLSVPSMLLGMGLIREGYGGKVRLLSVT